MPKLFLKLTKIWQLDTVNSSISKTALRFEDTPARNAFGYLQMIYIAVIAYFSYPSLIRRPRSPCSIWNFAAKLTERKLESWGYILSKDRIIVAGVVLA